MYVSSLGRRDKDYNLTLAVNIPDRVNHPDELQYYFNAPLDTSWAAFGFGNDMNSALMFIFYWDQKADNWTVSPRISRGHNEPTYNQTIDHSMENFGSGISRPNILVRGRCRNCMSWPGGAIDVNSTAQPMLYAIGPDVALHTNALDAGLRRHEHYGSFTMDLVAAEGDPDVFSRARDFFATANAAGRDGGDHKDRDAKTYAHAFFTAGVFLIAFPFGAAYVRLNSVRWHWVMQSVGVVGMLIGVGIALVLSKQYNRVRSFAFCCCTHGEVEKPGRRLTLGLTVETLLLRASAPWTCRPCVDPYPSHTRCPPPSNVHPQPQVQSLCACT